MDNDLMHIAQFSYCIKRKHIRLMKDTSRRPNCHERSNKMMQQSHIPLIWYCILQNCQSCESLLSEQFNLVSPQPTASTTGTLCYPPISLDGSFSCTLVVYCVDNCVQTGCSSRYFDLFLNKYVFKKMIMFKCFVLVYYR